MSSVLRSPSELVPKSFKAQNAATAKWLMRATINTLPDRLVLLPQRLRPQNAKNIMTSKAITTFNQWQLRPLVRVASPLPPFWVVLQRNLLMRLVTPGSNSGSTSVCPWLWSVETLPAYWPVCKFDLLLPVLFLVASNVLTTIIAYHLPWITCSFFLPNPCSFCKIHCSVRCAVLPCALVKYIVSHIAYDKSTAWCHVPHCLKPEALKKLKYSSFYAFSPYYAVFRKGSIYFTSDVLAATYRLELLCSQSNIWSRGMT